MRFFVNPDTTHGIHFWITPDNPISISRVRINIDGRCIAELSAWLTDEAIKSNGWHSTGRCMFRITENEVPGLTKGNRLEIYDVDTNVLIYRDVRDQKNIHKKVLIIETSIQKDNNVIYSLFPYFGYNYSNIDKMPEETAYSIIAGPWLKSSLLCGSLIFPRYENFFDESDSGAAVLISDPYIEMAKRLLWLKSKSDLALDLSQNWRLGAKLEAALFIVDYDFDKIASIKRFFRLLPESAYRFLYNPLCRQFGTRSPDENLLPGHSITAIDVLSRVKIVGHSELFESYSRTLQHYLEINTQITPPPALARDVHLLSLRLRELKDVREMVVFDVAISDAVRDAVSQGWTQ